MDNLTFSELREIVFLSGIQSLEREFNDLAMDYYSGLSLEEFNLRFAERFEGKLFCTLDSAKVVLS